MRKNIQSSVLGPGRHSGVSIKYPPASLRRLFSLTYNCEAPKKYIWLIGWFLLVSCIIWLLVSCKTRHQQPRQTDQLHHHRYTFCYFKNTKIKQPFHLFFISSPFSTILFTHYIKYKKHTVYFLSNLICEAW